jgi:iron complex outermembrane receptor protein
VTSVGNVARIRNQGVELAAQKDNVLYDGVTLFGSVTYVDSRIVSDPSWAGTNPLSGLPDSVVGKRVPYVPDWRTTFGVTYRPDTHWAFTAAARYSGKQYSTLDNTDIVPHVFGAFDNYFVVDTRIHYQATENVFFDFGVDNINNEKYFLYHPFPGRTFVADARIKF